MSRSALQADARWEVAHPGLLPALLARAAFGGNERSIDLLVCALLSICTLQSSSIYSPVDPDDSPALSPHISAVRRQLPAVAEPGRPAPGPAPHLVIEVRHGCTLFVLWVLLGRSSSCRCHSVPRCVAMPVHAYSTTVQCVHYHDARFPVHKISVGHDV